MIRLIYLPISKAGGSCHNQAGVIANNICGELRYGYPAAIYDGRVQAVAQMGLSAGMPYYSMTINMMLFQHLQQNSVACYVTVI